MAQVDRRVWAPLLGALGLGLVGWALFGGGGDEKRILEKLMKLEETVHLEEESRNPVMRLARVRGELKEIVQSTVLVEIPEAPPFKAGRDGLAELATSESTWFRSADVRFDAIDVKVSDDKQSA